MASASRPSQPSIRSLPKNSNGACRDVQFKKQVYIAFNFEVGKGRIFPPYMLTYSIQNEGVLLNQSFSNSNANIIIFVTLICYFYEDFSCPMLPVDLFFFFYMRLQFHCKIQTKRAMPKTLEHAFRKAKKSQSKIKYL